MTEAVDARRLGVCEHEEACGCWGNGYAAGKDKAHFEVRNVLDGSHAGGCGCEPCITVRIVALQLARRWGADI